MTAFDLGINYWPRRSAMEMWQRFDAGEIAEDFARIAALGLRSVRFFLRWADFQPARTRMDSTMLARLLLVMDNFEHLLDGAVLVSEIIDSAREVKILTTSREALNLQEEWVRRVDGMRFPASREVENAGDYSAIRLFVERARRVRANFSLADEWDNVVRICQLVQGMPLAIELATTWLKTLPCARIADEIQYNLDFLASLYADPQVMRWIGDGTTYPRDEVEARLGLTIAIERERVLIGPNRCYLRRRGEALHEAREPLEVLEQIKRDVGSLKFAAQYQQQFTTFGQQGYRLVDISGYAVGGEDRYAAIWEQRQGPDWAARHGMTSEQYQQEFNTLSQQGYRLVRIRGWRSGDVAHYAAIWEKTGGPAWVARHGMLSDAFQEEFDTLVKDGYRLRHISGYHTYN